MTFLDQVQNYVVLRKSGKNMVGPCPKCGGTRDSDRFVVNTVKDFGHCYSCGFNTDVIRLLREMEGLSCPDAHREADRRCDSPDCPAWSKCSKGEGRVRQRRDDRATPAAPREEKGYTPTMAEDPDARWQDRAQEYVTRCHQRLLESPEQLAYLASRGLPREAVVKYQLGWIPETEFKSRRAWGLPDKWHNDEQRWITSMGFQQGILIPWFINGRVHRLRYRKAKVSGPKDPRYMWVDGSGTDIVCLNPQAGAHCVVESDLDGLLVDWLAGDLVGAVPLGSCSVHPKASVYELLNKSLRILVAMDFDGEIREGKVHAPGAKASQWWKTTFPFTARRWPVPKGKDPGEAYAEGVNLRDWVVAGLPPAMRVSSQGREEVKALPRSFDREGLQRLLSITTKEVIAARPAGAQTWLDQNHPSLVKELVELSKIVDDAYAAEDEATFLETLEAWRLQHLNAWAVYECSSSMPSIPSHEKTSMGEGANGL
ncbi:hypothetical protein KP001_16310 [Geomonas subterranea]|uniref:Zinc finger CHC2-type domain-containing protein n=1 Tax=Geomonas subterranea TaxID=2847989 RepID=A0ABX8LGZ8_9BACT|nr:CHC2 zinc finger domain-containing protein [Geomonas subterranea]QXE89969.1 hypothetical protein KP001_16310 [Geomonas subterranea]QXM07911.1 hypothetical protein KP002_12970 [Geomonas subterranea]